MTTPRFRLLVCDLDNTLYDWVTYFARSFTAMLDVLAGILDVPKEVLKAEYQAVHQYHRSSEHPFATLDLPSVKRRFQYAPREALAASLGPAFSAFEQTRHQTLVLYPGVRETLSLLRSRGVAVVAHTEAETVNAVYRLKHLGIRDCIDHLYGIAWKGQSHPDGRTPRPRDWVTELPETKRKPNPELLSLICAKYAVPAEQVLYVGDSLTRDILMAARAGVASAWARYGKQYSPEDWQRLVEITHWTEADVQREQALRHESADILPDYVLDSFDQLLPLVDGK